VASLVITTLVLTGLFSGVTKHRTGPKYSDILH